RPAGCGVRVVGGRARTGLIDEVGDVRDGVVDYADGRRAAIPVSNPDRIVGAVAVDRTILDRPCRRAEVVVGKLDPCGDEADDETVFNDDDLIVLTVLGTGVSYAGSARPAVEDVHLPDGNRSRDRAETDRRAETRSGRLDLKDFDNDAR